MPFAIIGGTGITQLSGLDGEQQIIRTRFGEAHLFVGRGKDQDLVFLPRHGPGHTVPPHRINYRANVQALRELGVERAFAIFAVGSLQMDLPPHSLVALDQILDFSHGRETTIYDGNDTGVGHTNMTEPFCSGLRQALLQNASAFGLTIRPRGMYICINGPRFETAAEVRWFAQQGGDVVGMTCMPEAALARELGIHYAAVAHSINWAAGLKGDIELVDTSKDVQRALLELGVKALRTPTLDKCRCENATLFVHPPSAS